jgi:4-amino-4-deoxy-L-arabinose transferase
VNRSAAHLLALLLLGSLMLFSGLGGMAAMESTDARYLEISREMYASRDVLIPSLAGAPHLDKPPFTYWAACLGFALFGVDPFGGRFVEQVALLATCAALLLHARRFLPLAWAFAASLIFLTSALTFGASRGLSTDLFQLFFLTWAMLLLCEGTNDRGSAARVALALALLGASMLVKGPVAVLVAGTVLAPYLLLTRGRSRLPGRGILAGAALFLALGLPWFVFILTHHLGGWDYFVSRQLASRVAAGGEGHPHGAAYYLWTWPLVLLPWTPLALLTFWRLLPRGGRRSADRIDLFLLLWSIIPLLLFSLFATKLPNYILPAVPGTALAIGRAGAKGLLDDRWGSRALILSALLVAVVAAGCGSLLLHSPWLATLAGGSVDASRLVAPELFGASLLCLGGVGVFWALWRMRSGSFAAGVIAVGVGAAALFSLSFSAVAPALPSLREAGILSSSVSGARLVQHGMFAAGPLFHSRSSGPYFVAAVSRFCSPPAEAGDSAALCLKHEEALDMLRADAPTFSLAKRRNEEWIRRETGARPVLRYSKYVLLANPAAYEGLREAGHMAQSEVRANAPGDQGVFDDRPL